jgi:1,4-dihydroxy-2-naphthoate octaprenyltransferase
VWDDQFSAQYQEERVMTREDLKHNDPEIPDPKPTNSSHIVMADSVQAEEVPTIPFESLQTINALQPEISVHSTESTSDVKVPAPLVAQPTEYHRSFREWVQIWKDGIRPGYIVLPLMPFLVGNVLAWMQTVSKGKPTGYFHFTHFIMGIIAILLLQTGANLVNDYYDYVRGIDTSNALGPGGLIQQGLIKPTVVLVLGLSSLTIGSIVGLIVALVGGPLILFLGLVAVVCAYFYSATSRSLSSLALGELVGFCVFGPIATVVAYAIQSEGYFSAQALVYSLPLGLLAAAVILANNLRDAEDDEHAGKITLPLLIGIPWSRVLYTALLLMAFLIIIFIGTPHGAPHLILITLWALPEMIIAITGILRTAMPAALHVLLKQTLHLQTAFALLLVLALIVSTLISQLSFLSLPFLHH